MRISEAADHPYSRLHAYAGLGDLWLVRGELTRAITLLERGHSLARATAPGSFLIYFGSSLGRAVALSGRPDEAQALLEEAIERASAIGMLQFQASLTVWLGESRLQAGRWRDATDCARRALELAREHGERGHEGWALRFLGEVAAGTIPPGTGNADRYYRQALALATELGMRPLIAHCHFGLGKLYRRLGKREPAQEHLTTATTMYGEMGMGFWLEQAKAEMSVLA